MDQELEGLSWDERNQRIRTLLEDDPFFEPLRTRIVERAEPFRLEARAK
jgi:hypothetical protein